MKLCLESLKNPGDWKGYELPRFDPAVIAENTTNAPEWLHFGPGNIFRVFPAALCQKMIEQGKMDTGIICCEGYDEEVVTGCLRPHDNLTIGVTLNPDGRLDKQIIASVCESLCMTHDMGRLGEIFRNPSLQLVSFTITEKGYSLRDAKGRLFPAVEADMKNGPRGCRSFWGQLTGLCLERAAACEAPLALVSMDNCSHNGEKLQNAVMEMAGAWLTGGKIEREAYEYLQKKLSFPWSMIDKITPRPHPAVERQLAEDGLEEIEPFVTAKNTYTAPFVNAEKPQYLVIEDDFPNGRPALEDVGVIFTDRDTVNRVERMKVCTCLNPLHTCLAIFGCLLGYDTIAREMEDEDLAAFARALARREGMPVVEHPGVIDPEAFLEEVLTVRLPNPYLPDTPQRIATDTSQKLAIRFGQTIKAYMASPELDVTQLKLIPLVQAGWLRYLVGMDDEGRTFEPSPDPQLHTMQEKLAGMRPGGEIDTAPIREILSDEGLWGVDLNRCALGERVAEYFCELMAGPGAVRAALKKYVYEFR